ncbi:MAG: hypothetical protein ACLTMP_08475 [Eggerthella lenta]
MKPDEFGGAQTTGRYSGWANPGSCGTSTAAFANESTALILNGAPQPNHTVVDIWDSVETYLDSSMIPAARACTCSRTAPTNMTLETVKGINRGCWPTATS